MKVSSIVKNPVMQKVASKINPQMRKVAASAMMTTAVLGGVGVANAKPINNDKAINQTEVISTEGAKALANQVIQKQTDIYGGNYNIKRLDAQYLSIFSKNTAERTSLKNEINGIRNVYGPYLTAMYLQAAMYDKLFNEGVVKNETEFVKYYELAKAKGNDRRLTTDDISTFKTRATNLSGKIDEFNQYFASIVNYLYQNGATNFEDCSRMLDKILSDFANSTGRSFEIREYNDKVQESFAKDLSSYTENYKEEILALKTFLIYDTLTDYYISQFDLFGIFNNYQGFEAGRYRTVKEKIVKEINSSRNMFNIVNYIENFEKGTSYTFPTR